MTPRGGVTGEPATDEQLVARLKAGDSAALWELWQGHRAQLRRLCRRWMGGRAEDADDALSTAMLKTWELLPAQAESLVSVRAWLVRLTYNVCMDFHREQQRRARLSLELGEPAPLLSEPPWGRHSPEEALLRRELSARVRRAIGGLPAPLREPVLLRFFREMPHRDIALELKLSSDNVRKRLQYARDILGRRLERLVAVPAPRRRSLPARVRAAPRTATSLAE
jgi:RNA polymerase sigma-70 factor, ECF subfamily